MSKDSGHEYKWHPASNIFWVTSCGVAQITKATFRWQTSHLKVMLGANCDADGMLIMTRFNCVTTKILVSIMNSPAGDKIGFVPRL